MPSFNIIKEIIVDKTYRVASVMGKFDLSSEKVKEHFIGNIEFEKEDWQIGLIVGSSGTGKTTIAKELFKNAYIKKYNYKEKSILDDFSKDLSIDEITKTFNSVGFSSPPSWLKPYAVLSNGEKMRVDLARAILSKKKIIVFDEFTSVIDRNVAKIGCFALNKSIKRTDKKFIGVSCHFDIIDWLQPDWIFNTDKMIFEKTRGLLRRPKIKLKIFEEKGMWNLFRKYHYLNMNINNSSKQYIGYINNEPVAFCAVLHFPHPRIKNMKKVTRLVVLPDYQGIGIGNRLLNYIAEYYVNKKYRFTIVTSTPALINSFRKSNNWMLKRFGRLKAQSKGTTVANMQVSRNRYTTSWEYKLCF